MMNSGSVIVNKLPPWTWHADVEEVSSGRTLTGIGVEIEQHGAEHGEEDAPRMRGSVDLRIDDFGLVRLLGSACCIREQFLFRIRVAHELAEKFAIGNQK